MKQLFVLLLIFASLGSAVATPLRPETIRVALAKGAESIRLDGNGILALDENGEPLRLSYPVVVKRAKDGLTVNGQFIRRMAVTSSSPILVNGKGYRGTLEITSQEKGLLIIDELPLEDYLVGVINCEISSQWPIDAIKTQAVVARTYAIYQKKARSSAPYHLESTTMDQVYEGCDIEDSRAARGVRETLGEVLSHDGQVIQAFYHSSCGGHTETPENVWGLNLPYLRGVDCKYCASSPSVMWTQNLPLRKIESLLRASGLQINGLKDIRPGGRNSSGRISDLLLVTSRGVTLTTAVNFRKAVGYTVIKSTNFDVKIDGENALFTGSGYGHGVGLCQWGTKQRSADGFNYREILAYYYPGARLEKLYSE